MGGYMSVRPQRRRRSRWLLLVWLAGTVGVTVQWAVRSPGPWWMVLVVGVGFGVLFGAAVVGRSVG